MKKDIFLQSYFKGFPFLSYRRETFKGAGNVYTSAIQSGKPSPQNLRLYRSWWASIITEML